MSRLQGKLRDFIRIEKELRQEIENVTDKDKNLVEILENTICFGKVLFVIKPVITQSLTNIQAKVEIECHNMYENRDSETQDTIHELGRSIEDFYDTTKEKKQNQVSSEQNQQSRNAIVLQKEVRQKSEEYKTALQELT